MRYSFLGNHQSSATCTLLSVVLLSAAVTGCSDDASDDESEESDAHEDDEHEHEDDEHEDDEHEHEDDEHEDDEHEHEDDEHEDDEHEDDDHEHEDAGADDHEHEDDEHEDDDHEHEEDAGAHEEVTYSRLLVSDGSEGRVVVVDLDEGTAIATLMTEGPARVYSSSDHSRGFAVQTNDDVVQGINPGISYVDHGDHIDVTSADPSLLSEVVVSCETPIHFVTHNERAAAFCDGDGMLYVFEDSGIGETFDVDVHDSGRAHHGVGLVAFDHVLLSAPNLEVAEDPLPIGVRVMTLEGEEEASFEECPSLHGEASSESHVCFGCADGVMCIASEADGFSSVKLGHPEDAAEGVRVGTLSASPDSDRLLGNWGPDLAVVDPSTDTLTTVPLAQPYLKFELLDDAQALVLTEAGELLKVNLDDGEVAGSVEVFEAFTVEPGHGQLRPTFLVQGDHVYVVDPRDPQLHEIEVETMTATDRMIDLASGEFHSLAYVTYEVGEGH